MLNYKWLFVINFIAILGFIYLDNTEDVFCGYAVDESSLAFGVQPSWFDGNFQLNIGYKEIISSNNSNEVYYDRWVKGTEFFKKILAYDKNYYGDKVYFKAIDFNGRTEIFTLKEYVPKKLEEYAFEVTLKNDNESLDHNWFSVDSKFCDFRSFRYLIILIFVNIILFFSLLFYRK